MESKKLKKLWIIFYRIISDKKYYLRFYSLAHLIESLAGRLCFNLEDFTSLAIDRVEFMGHKFVIDFSK